MLTRPNIFNYAKKELSQDAVICWLLECCHSDDDKYRQIGIDFVRFILDNENIKEKDIELEKDSPRSQYKNMDVYANIRVGKTIIPVIFEDKTDTFLHDNQESKYIEKIEKNPEFSNKLGVKNTSDFISDKQQKMNHSQLDEC